MVQSTVPLSRRALEPGENRVHGAGTAAQVAERRRRKDPPGVEARGRREPHEAEQQEVEGSQHIVRIGL